MTDIVTSLRQWTDRDGQTTPLGKAAADEIERLRAALRSMIIEAQRQDPREFTEFSEHIIDHGIETLNEQKTTPGNVK